MPNWCKIDKIQWLCSRMWRTYLKSNTPQFSDGPMGHQSWLQQIYGESEWQNYKILCAHVHPRHRIDQIIARDGASLLDLLGDRLIEVIMLKLVTEVVVPLLTCRTLDQLTWLAHAPVISALSVIRAACLFPVICDVMTLGMVLLSRARWRKMEIVVYYLNYDGLIFWLKSMRKAWSLK